MSTLYYVLYGSALGAPSAAQIKVGQNVNGVAAIASGNATSITTTQSPYTFGAATGLTGSTSYKVSFVWSDGTDDSNVVTSDAFTTSADIQSGAGASTGVATASATGASTAASAGSSTGAGTAAGAGAATTASAGSASGSATVSGVGQAVVQDSGAGSSSGSSTASGVGASNAAASGSASGTSTASAVGEALAAGSAAGSASGTSTASAVGASIAAAAGSAAGTSTASGVAPGGEPEARQRSGGGKRPRRPIVVRIDDEEFIVETPAEAQQLIAQAERLAETAAKAKAEELAARTTVRMRAARRAAPVVRIEAPEPVAEVEAIRERVAETNARIQAMYVDALRTALIAREIQRRMDEDEEDALAALML